MIEITSKSYEARFAKRKARNKDANDYINNALLYDEMVRWKESGDSKVSDELGRMFLILAKKVTAHRHFSRYPVELKEEMVNESVLVLLKGASKFNIEFKNPFAYFTQFCFNANIGVIKKYYAENASTIQYFLANTSEIDVSDGHTLAVIEQAKLYSDSKANSAKKAKHLKSNKPTLFDIDEFVKELTD
jgi:hypothetical protein